MLCPRGPQAPPTGRFLSAETPVLPAAPTTTPSEEVSPPDLWPCPPLFLLPVTTLSFRDKWQLLLDNTSPLKSSFSPVVIQSLSHVGQFVTPWTAGRKASLSITNSRSLLKLVFTESMMPSNHPILCHPLLLPPSIFPRIRVFSNE